MGEVRFVQDSGIKQPPYEVEIYHKNGTIRSLQVLEVPVFDDNRRVIADRKSVV